MIDRRRLILLLGTVLWWPLLARANPDTAAEPLLDELSRIEQQAALVESARADFVVTYMPTTSEEKRRLQIFYRLRGQESQADGMFRDEHSQRRNNYHATWLRKGIMEREEQVKTARPAQTTTTVFDGRTIKVLDNSPFRSQMQINTDANQWLRMLRIEPFAFALEYSSGLPHGEIIRKASERHMTRVSEPDGSEANAIVVRHPTNKQFLMRLVFDDRHRLIAREFLLPQPPGTSAENSQPLLKARHEFIDHKPYDDGKGNTIWFPSTAILREYVGNLPDGSPVQGQATQIDIVSLDFNVEIPDEKFKLEAPAGTPVFGN